MRRCATTLEPEMTPAELQLLTGLIEEKAFSGLHLEVGTAAGGTLCRMLAALPAMKPGQFRVVDPMTYFPQQLEIVRGNLREHELDDTLVDFRVSTSDDALSAATAEGVKFDFMLIDGRHDLWSVMRDLRWTRLLNACGIVCLHDYGLVHSGVKLAVDRFCKSHPHFSRIGQAGSLVALQKNQFASRAEVSLADETYAFCWSWTLEVERKLARRRAKFQNRKAA
jgi:Methyltransferase domain